jgi:hypothetical protein
VTSLENITSAPRPTAPGPIASEDFSRLPEGHHASFGDMLATLRQRSLREAIIPWGLSGPGSHKILQTLENTIALAA